MLLLRLLLRLRRTFTAATTTAATATPAAATRPALTLRLLLLLLRLCLLLLLLLLRALRTVSARRALVAASAFTALARRTLSRRTAFFFAPLLAGPLLELLHLALHELPRLRFLLRAHFVVAAVGTALPTFGIGLLASRADYAFGQRHRNRRALYTSGPMQTDDRRRATLRTLIELAEGSNPQDCWDDQRAEDLLRSQSSPDELRELGMSEQMIARIFPEKR